MRFFAVVAGVVFAGFALLQLNDPDPWRWFAIYAVTAGLFVASAFALVPRALCFALSCVAAGWAATLVPTVLSVAAFTGTEEEREIAGLALVALSGIALGSRARAAERR